MPFPPLNLELYKFAAVMEEEKKKKEKKSGGKALQLTDKSCTSIELHAFANILCSLNLQIIRKSISPPPRTIHCMCYF